VVALGIEILVGPLKPLIEPNPLLGWVILLHPFEVLGQIVQGSMAGFGFLGHYPGFIGSPVDFLEGPDPLNPTFQDMPFMDRSILGRHMEFCGAAPHVPVLGIHPDSIGWVGTGQHPGPLPITLDSPQHILDIPDRRLTGRRDLCLVGFPDWPPISGPLRQNPGGLGPSPSDVEGIGGTRIPGLEG
jgi:hypothetical protein